MKTGFIGLGAMGTGMAQNVARAGLLHAVYNRSPHKAIQLADHYQLVACSTSAQLAEQCDLVLLCVSADKDVLEIIDSIAPKLHPGSIVIDMSTVSIDTAQKAEAILLQQHCLFIDAPVSGGVEGAANGTLAMMTGGDEQALAQAMPVLQCMSTRIVHMGTCGAGQATKAVNQIMAAGINQAVCEALAFGQTQGLNMAKVIDVVSGGAAGNWFLQHRGLTMTQGIFKPGFKVALHHKDLTICQQMASDKGIDIPLTEQTRSDYQALMEQGYADEDISALYRLKRTNKHSS